VRLVLMSLVLGTVDGEEWCIEITFVEGTTLRIRSRIENKR
jgi:hypothetical protein